MPKAWRCRDRHLAAFRALMSRRASWDAMTVHVRLPSALRSYADGATTIDVDAATVKDALRAVASRHERLRGHLFDETGEIRGFVGLYLNQTDVKKLQREATPTRAGDVLIVLPSVAGGAA